MSDLVSVIVPAYNDEKYTELCFNSIKKQDYKNFEVLICLRCGNKACEDLCKKFCNDDERFRLITTNQAGVSFARNLGLKQAKGEYIAFVDADDVIENDYLSTFVKYISNCDMVICKYAQQRKYKKIKHNDKQIKVEYKNPVDTMNNIICTNTCGYLWNKFFKKSILREQLFDEDIHFAEDLLFCHTYLLKCKNVAYINKKMYHYIKHKGSITTAKFNKKQLTCLDAMDKIIASAKDERVKNNALAWKGCFTIMLMWFMKTSSYKDEKLRTALLQLMKICIPNIKKSHDIKWYVRWNIEFVYFIFKMLI